MFQEQFSWGQIWNSRLIIVLPDKSLKLDLQESTFLAQIIAYRRAGVKDLKISFINIFRVLA
jgi:hypothetical protein